MTWAFLGEALWRSTALLIGGTLLLRLSKRQSAAFRHRLLLGILALLAVLPVLSAILPAIPFPFWRPIVSETASVTVRQVSARTVARQQPYPPAWPNILWLLGFTVTLAPALTGTFSVFRIVRSARELDKRALHNALGDVKEESPGVPIFLSHAVSVPMTCGLLRPRIVLPASATDWTSARLRAVLSHELSHVRRRDLAAQVFAHLVAAVWWFQPGIWVLRRKLRLESEMACDAEAVRTGVKPSDYASELLAIAKSIGKETRLSSLAIGMSQTRPLELRLRAVLMPSCVPSPPARTLVLSTFLAAFAVGASSVTGRSNYQLINQGEPTMKNTILSALFTSVSLSAATVSGSVNSSAGQAIPDAKVLVYNPDTGAKQEVSTNSDGTFTVSGAGAGQYILRVEKPGFDSIFRMFDVKADSSVNRQITMAEPGTPPTPDTVNSAQGSESKPIRIGGQVAQSNLTAKLQPVYPVAAKRAGVQGTVELEITVTKDGIPAELRVLRSPSDDLSESALEAVRQWRYRPTLLNGSPVEVVSTVVVNYTLTR
jgi:TonB family protein